MKDYNIFNMISSLLNPSKWTRQKELSTVNAALEICIRGGMKAIKQDLIRHYQMRTILEVLEAGKGVILKGDGSETLELTQDEFKRVLLDHKLYDNVLSIIEDYGSFTDDNTLIQYVNVESENGLIDRKLQFTKTSRCLA